MMEVETIKAVVEQTFKTTFKTLLNGKKNEVLRLRYLFVVMMFEEGYCHSEIARQINRDRSSVLMNLRAIDILLRNDLEFKTDYLTAVKTLEDEY